MKLLSKRLFINNLPDGITQSDINKKFSEYGAVTSVEIKDRKNVIPNQTPHFAYVQLDIEKTNLLNCLDEFANAQWKGYWLSVQEAKESFMERLKREREESSTQTSTSNLVTNNSVKSNGAVTHTVKEKPKKAKVSSTLKSVAKGDTERSENDAIGVTKIQDDSLNVKIGSVDGKLFDSNINDVKKSEADKKRLQSVKKMKKEYQQQKLLIKNALAHTDAKLNNKITFNDDDEEPPIKKTKRTVQTDKQSEKKMALFDDDDDNNDDNEVNFEIREHLEGRKGQKLIELQSRFKGDRRFNMDAKFLDDKSSSESENEEKEEDSIESEKRKQFEILEEVLGKKIIKKAPEKAGLKGMLRFDPLQSEHSKYEIKEPPKPPVSKEKKKKLTPKPQEEPDKPEVSKDTFYKVQVDFKETLQENNQFSLANTFNVQIEEGREEETEIQQTSKEVKQNNLQELDPFKYDSSSGDEDNVNEIDKTTVEKQQTPTNDIARNKTARLWTDSFFFKEDDYRLEEGLSFIKRLELDEAGDFLSMRRDLKQAVKAKVKNNLRKNNPFKRKLGGKKRLKVKRALKR